MAGPLSDERSFRVPPRARGEPAPRLDGVLRRQLAISWGDARGLVERGKVFVDGARATASDLALRGGEAIEVRMHARRVHATEEGPFAIDARSIAFVDPHLVVVRKPAGISTIPYDDREEDTLIARVHGWLVRHKGQATQASLGVVHRIDKETSGLLVFTRSLAAKKAMTQAFRVHAIERRYVALVHGVFASPRKISSTLIADRGDGIRGSARGRTGQEGQHAVTEVRPLGVLSSNVAGVGATAVRCVLETGRTHQIRIHLSEAGHPLVGEKVYDRDHRRADLPVIAAPRMMLHAAVLGFTHPVSGRPLRFTEPLPADMRAAIAELSSGAVDTAALDAAIAG
jgi:23S rRNA pseudouridine1911/1915/1917 synthase